MSDNKLNQNAAAQTTPMLYHTADTQRNTINRHAIQQIVNHPDLNRLDDELLSNVNGGRSNTPVMRF